MEAWVGGVGVAFRLFLGDIRDVSPLRLKRFSNRTAMVEYEGPEPQCDTGVEGKN